MITLQMQKTQYLKRFSPAIINVRCSRGEARVLSTDECETQCSAECVTLSLGLFNFTLQGDMDILLFVSSSLLVNFSSQYFLSSALKSNGVLSSCKVYFHLYLQIRAFYGRRRFILFGAFVSRKGQKVSHQFCNVAFASSR